MRTRIFVQLDPMQLGKEPEVRRELEKLGIELDQSESGKGTLVGHADPAVLRRVGEVRGIRTLRADPIA